MKFFNKLRKKFGWYDLRSELAKWVKKNIGSDHVDEALDKYDKINRGIPIGGFNETVVFLHMVEQIKKEALT